MVGARANGIAEVPGEREILVNSRPGCRMRGCADATARNAYGREEQEPLWPRHRQDAHHRGQLPHDNRKPSKPPDGHEIHSGVSFSTDGSISTERNTAYTSG